MRNDVLSSVTPAYLPTPERPVSVCRLTPEPWQSQRDTTLTLLYFEAQTNFLLDHQPATAAPGVVLLLPPGTELSGLNRSVWRLSFQLDLMKPFETGLGDTYKSWASLRTLTAGGVRRYQAGEPQVWLTSLRALEGELSVQDLGYCETSKAYLTLLTVHLARLARADLEVSEGIANPLVAKVMSYVERHYAEPISLSRVAERFHRSAPYLTTLFTQETGRSLNDCIIERRVEEAKRLLEYTELSVSEVGERVGYPEPTHFSRLFRKRDGRSPTAFRETKRNVKLNKT